MSGYVSNLSISTIFLLNFGPVRTDIFPPFIIGYGGRRGRGRDRMEVGFTTISAYHN